MLNWAVSGYFSFHFLCDGLYCTFVCSSSRLFLGIYFVLLPEFDFAALASNTCKIFVQLSPMQLMLFHTNELLNELMSYEIHKNGVIRCLQSI